MGIRFGRLLFITLFRHLSILKSIPVNLCEALYEIEYFWVGYCLMPTLTRFLMILFILFSVLFIIMGALVVWVEPVTVDMYIDVPLDSWNLSTEVNQ